jgi:hypothetical protein
MTKSLDPFRFLLMAVSGWMNQQQLELIDYLREENRVLREPGLQRFFILFFMELSTRKVEIAGIASGPSGLWMTQIGRNLTDAVDGLLKGKRYLIHDRDPLFTAEFLSLLAEAAVASMKLPPRSPNLKACVSYCTLFLLCDSESWLLRGVSSMAFHDRVFVQWFVKTTLGIVVTMLLKAAFSCPEIDCRGRYTVAHTHLFGRKQPLGSQAAVARSQTERLPDMRNFL